MSISLKKKLTSPSTETPNGAEGLALQRYGKNQMCPQCAAYLILEVVSGRLIHDERSVEYMTDLLVHFRWTGYSSFGFGLPPGTIMKTKIGDAYDTVEGTDDKRLLHRTNILRRNCSRKITQRKEIYFSCLLEWSRVRVSIGPCVALLLTRVNKATEPV